jgi:hypothetical protein
VHEAALCVGIVGAKCVDFQHACKPRRAVAPAVMIIKVKLFVTVTG